MKKIIITTFFTLCASLAYAGAGCGDCSGDKKDTDTKSGLTESSIVVAGNCGSGCGGDKTDTSSKLTQDSTLLAGNCGSGCGGDKKGGDKSGLFTDSVASLA